MLIAVSKYFTNSCESPSTHPKDIDVFILVVIQKPLSKLCTVETPVSHFKKRWNIFQAPGLLANDFPSPYQFFAFKRVSNLFLLRSRLQKRWLEEWNVYQKAFRNTRWKEQYITFPVRWKPACFFQSVEQCHPSRKRRNRLSITNLSPFNAACLGRSNVSKAIISTSKMKDQRKYGS